MPFRIIWADVESGASGWTNVAADRQVFNGFYDTIVAGNNGLVPGVYSTNVRWNSIMAARTLTVQSVEGFRRFRDTRRPMEI